MNSFEGWPTSAALVRKMLHEANSAAKRLDHKLEAWINQGRIWQARCVCGDYATVRPKGLGSEIGGAATVLRCRG